MGTTDRDKSYETLVKHVTQPGRARDDQGRRVLHTLKPDYIPHDPFGPGGFKLENDDADYLTKPDPQVRANVQANKSRFGEKHSEAPNFKLSETVDAPVLNRGTGEITMGRKTQFYVDPEKFISGTLNYPGSTGMTGEYERAVAQHHGDPVPAYGGSTDARAEDMMSHRSTAEVWSGKEEDVTSPAGAFKEKVDPQGNKKRFKVNSAGLFARLMGGEKILNPAHHIIDPQPPKYGPRVLTHTELDPRGKPTKVSHDDAGGFGHDQPVQWEGHHRMMAAALKQKAQREAGVQDWGVPVPVDLHFGTDRALSNIPLMKISEGITERRSRRKAALRGMLGIGGSTGGPDPNNVKQPKRVLGARLAPGTWNSKAY